MRDIPAFVMYCVYGASRSSLLVESTDSMIDFLIQWNLIITVTLGPNLAGCYIEVAFLLSGIQNHHN